MKLDKCQELSSFLELIDLSERDWKVVDYWESDFCAVGLSRQGEPKRLVYISTFNRASGRYSFECEVLTGPDPTDYSVVDSSEDAGFDELLEALEQHLGS